jgi:hypothetical protein
MNFKFYRVAAIATIIGASLAPFSGEAHDGPPRIIKKTSDSRNSLIDRGRRITTTAELQSDGTLIVTDVLKNKVALNGYKSKTWVYVLDKHGNTIRRFTLTNWAEGTYMPGPSRHRVEKFFKLSEQDAADAFSVKIVHTQRGGKAPNVLKRMEKEIEFAEKLANK